MRADRLKTEELIQATRNNYDISKQQERYHEIEITLQLRNKQIQYLTSQIGSIKQEYSVKVKMLQEELNTYKKDIAQIRFINVKEKRVQSQIMEHQIIRQKKQFQENIRNKNIECDHRIQEIKKNHEEQIQNLKEKYQRYVKIQKNENAMCKSINQEQNMNSSALIRKLQEDKNSCIQAKRQIQRELISCKEALQTLGKDYLSIVQEKQSELSQKQRQIEGLKFKIKLLEEKIEQNQSQRVNNEVNSTASIQKLKQINEKLEKDLQKYRELLNQKDDELFKQLKDISNKKNLDQSFHPVHECNHQGLIHQMEKNLKLKDKQLQQFSKIFEQWTQIIGFDKPVSKRLEELSQKCLNTNQINENWSGKLKKKASTIKKKRNIHF